MVARSYYGRTLTELSGKPSGDQTETTKIFVSHARASSASDEAERRYPFFPVPTPFLN